MICPKCQDMMHTVERRGVHFEQCARCHGIFLDHGELEQLASAERTYYAPPAAPMHGGGHRDSPRGYRPPGDSPRAYGGPGGHGGYGHHDSPGPYRGHGGHGGYAPGYGGHYGDSPRPYGHRGKRKGFLDQLFG